NIKLAALGISQHLVERRPPVLRPAHPFVDVFDALPAARLDIAPELLELVLRLLVQSTDARVDGGPHGSTVASVVPALIIWSAALKIRCALRSGIGSAPRGWFQCWM